MCTWSPKVPHCELLLRAKLKSIKKSSNIIISADKTSNMYEMGKESYEKLLKENVTKVYKKVDDTTVNKINKKAKDIASGMSLDKKVQCYANRPAFIYIKDHKENFPAIVKCRLINPAKSEMGKISKCILDRINVKVREETKFLQWRNTNSVIKWFKKIKNKKKCKFLKFDIAEFYPSISKKLLSDSINFAKKYTDISEEEEEIIFHAKEALLFNGDSTWVKKNGRRGNFDVTMGSYDGSETAEIVGLFILDKLASKFGINNVGLYRDDGLAVLKNASGPAAERARKDIIELFKKYNLKVTTETNLTSTDFLDVYLDLKSGKFRPFHKPNQSPLYIHAESNHPPAILKRVPEMIGRRVSNISCNKSEFERSKPYYENALRRSGFERKLMYVSEKEPTKNKRKRKIIWFNPPFSKNVKTNVGRKFLNLVKKHFPPHHKFHKIFNRNSIKISYSCMDNFEAAINSHNAAILRRNEPQSSKKTNCNCQNKDECPLNNQCRTPCMVYKATVTAKNVEKYYVGSVEGEFKVRWRNHMKSLRNARYEHDTTLSTYVWSLKDQGMDPKIKWEILKKSTPYRCGGKHCNLCQEEKFCILEGDREKMLNEKSEILSKCRHKSKFLLSNFDKG